MPSCRRVRCAKAATRRVLAIVLGQLISAPIPAEWNTDCRDWGKPNVTILYPTQTLNVLPSLGFIAISINELFGLADSAEITLTTAGHKPIDVLAAPDNSGNSGVQTMHAALPRLAVGTYTVYVLLHDASVRCSRHLDDAYDLPSFTVVDQAVQKSRASGSSQPAN